MCNLRALAAASAFLSSIAACGGSEPPPKTAPKHQEEADEHADGPVLDVSAEIGALDEGKITKAFGASLKKLERCLADGAKRVEFIGGQAGFFVKIDLQGRVVHAHLEKSSLGDRETERCMLDALRAAQWPAPVGGQVGLARKGFDFDPPNDVRPPTEWDSGRVSGSIGSRAGEIKKCKGGAPGSFSATAYVGTDGRVLAAGVAASDEQGEAVVDCLVGVLKGMKFSSPISWPAKVSFEL